jgi:uncharacterized membrane protein HdeD (DUF308 family)
VSEHLHRYWFTLIARGLLALGVALVCLLRLGTDLPELTLLFGAYLVVDGAFAMLSAFGCEVCWGTLLLTGAADLFLGSLLLRCADRLTHLLSHVIVLWSLTLAALCIVSASEISKGSRSRWLFRAASVVLILLGIFLLLCPVSRVAVWQPWLCISLSLYGTLLTALGIECRGRRARRREHMPG